MKIIKKVFGHFKNRNSKWKLGIIKSYIYDKEKILDFGCGDMGLSKQLIAKFKGIKVIGVDVINQKSELLKNERLEFVRYNGRRLPFKDNSFDAAIAFYVLHHCENPEKLIRECLRVTKKRMIVIESVPHRNYELLFMKFLDYFFNIIKFDNTPLPYMFHTVSEWEKIFSDMGCKLISKRHPKSY